MIPQSQINVSPMVAKNLTKHVFFLGNTKTNLKSTMDVQIQITVRNLGALQRPLMGIMLLGVKNMVTVTWPIWNALMVRLEVRKKSCF